MAAVRFTTTEVVITLPRTAISLRNLVHLETLTFWGHAPCQTGTRS